MSWRRIDIDQYDEDAYTQDEILSEFETGLSPEQVVSATQTRSTDVRNLLTKYSWNHFIHIILILTRYYYRGDLNSALTRALEEPPYGRHLESAKVAHRLFGPKK